MSHIQFGLSFLEICVNMLYNLFNSVCYGKLQVAVVLCRKDALHDAFFEKTTYFGCFFIKFKLLLQ